MEVKTKKRLLGVPCKYLAENGKVLCKPEFSNIKIENVHGVTLITFFWYDGVYEEQGVLLESQVRSEFDRPFGIRDVLSCDNDIRNFANFTVLCNRKRAKVAVWNAMGELIEDASGILVELSDLGVRFIDQGKQYALLLNGDKLHKFEMSKYAQGFMAPREFMLSNIHCWSREALKQETAYLKAIIKNDLKRWDKATAQKHTVEDGRITVTSRVWDENEAIENAKSVMSLLRDRIAVVTDDIKTREDIEKQRQAKQQKIDAFCENIDSDNFGV